MHVLVITWITYKENLFTIVCIQNTGWHLTFQTTYWRRKGGFESHFSHHLFTIHSTESPPIMFFECVSLSVNFYRQSYFSFYIVIISTSKCLNKSMDHKIHFIERFHPNWIIVNTVIVHVQPRFRLVIQIQYTYFPVAWE